MTVSTGLATERSGRLFSYLHAPPSRAHHARIDDLASTWRGMANLAFRTPLGQRSTRFIGEAPKTAASTMVHGVSAQRDTTWRISLIPTGTTSKVAIAYDHQVPLPGNPPGALPISGNGADTERLIRIASAIWMSPTHAGALRG